MMPTLTDKRTRVTLSGMRVRETQYIPDNAHPGISFGSAFTDGPPPVPLDYDPDVLIGTAKCKAIEPKRLELLQTGPALFLKIVRQQINAR